VYCSVCSTSTVLAYSPFGGFFGMVFLFGAEPYSDLEGGFLGKGGGFFGMVFLFCGADVYSDLEGGFLGKGGGFFGNEFLCSVVVVGGAFVVAFGMSTLDITLAYSPFVDEGVDDISSP